MTGSQPGIIRHAHTLAAMHIAMDLRAPDSATSARNSRAVIPSYHAQVLSSKSILTQVLRPVHPHVDPAALSDHLDLSFPDLPVEGSRGISSSSRAASAFETQRTGSCIAFPRYRLTRSTSPARPCRARRAAGRDRGRGPLVGEHDEALLVLPQQRLMGPSIGPRRRRGRGGRANRETSRGQPCVARR